MSLSSILKCSEVVARLRGMIEKPKLSGTPPTLVPAGAKDSYRVGIAFDYALRFGLAQWFPLAKQRRLAAEGGLAVLVKDHPGGQLAKAAARTLSAAKSTLRDADLSSSLPDGAAAACFQLASLEVAYRSRRFGEIDRAPSGEEVKELLELFGIIPWNEFQPDERLLLNPSFGEGSLAVGGADADIVKDNLLIEIKTTKKQSVDLKTVRQLVAYALLANEFGVGDDWRPGTVQQLAVYFSRAGKLVSFDLYDCVDPGSSEDVLGILLDERYRQ